MDRKQIIEKQKALGGICQSKTGDAILRKNVFETRVLRTRLSELEIEERRWKTNYSFEVREARKEAHTRETAKHRSFREVARAAFAANKFKNLITSQRSGDHVDGVEGPKEADVEDEKLKETCKQSTEEEIKKNSKEEQQKTPQNKNESPSTNTTDISAREKANTPLRYSYSLPEKAQRFSNPLFTRRRAETFTGRSLKTTDSPRKVKSGIFTHGINGNEISPGICSSSLSENPCSIRSPMLDKRFLDLQAALVPMNQNEESTSENEEEGDDDDRESLDAVSSRSGSSMS